MAFSLQTASQVFYFTSLLFCKFSLNSCKHSYSSHSHPTLTGPPKYPYRLTAGPRAFYPLAHQSRSLLENEAHKSHHTSFCVRYRHLTCSSSRWRGTRVQLLQVAVLLQLPALISSLASLTPVPSTADFQDTRHACPSSWQQDFDPFL